MRFFCCQVYKKGRPDLTVQTLRTIQLIYNLVLIAHAQMPAHSLTHMLTYPK